MKVNKKIFLKSPSKCIGIYANSFYTRASGLEKICAINTSDRDDTLDSMSLMWSLDNGKNWTQPKEVKTNWKDEGGTHRYYPQPGFVDKTNDLFLRMVLEGILPDDDPLEGEQNFYLRYQVSRDGGKTFFIDEIVVQDGDEFNEHHPVPGVWIGKNALTIGDISCRPINVGKSILVPVSITPLNEDGEYYNPGGGYTYANSAVLIGNWKDQKLSWKLSNIVENNPKLSTRGVIEPTISEFADGRILMVARGCNAIYDAQNDSAVPAGPNGLKGHKWYTISDDGGYTWQPIKPWTYTDGLSFYSPSSCSQLFRHSNGKVYWIGNITPNNPLGNDPRYPLVIGEVDPKTLLLKKESVFVIDDCMENDCSEMTLSNFMAHEDRKTGQIILHMTPLFRKNKYLAGKFDWTANAYIYTILL